MGIEKRTLNEHLKSNLNTPHSKDTMDSTNETMDARSKGLAHKNKSEVNNGDIPSLSYDSGTTKYIYIYLVACNNFEVIV